MADNALAKQVGKKMPERRKTRLEQIADEIQAYGGRVRDDFMAGAERSAQGLGDIVERGDVLTGIPRLALGGTAWMGAPVSGALSPILNPILRPVGEAVNTYVGQPVEDLTGYPADITNDLAMTGLTLGAVKGLGVTRPYLARAADQVEGMANRAGYTLRKPANVYGSGPQLFPVKKWSAPQTRDVGVNLKSALDDYNSELPDLKFQYDEMGADAKPDVYTANIDDLGWDDVPEQLREFVDEDGNIGVVSGGHLGHDVEYFHPKSPPDMNDLMKQALGSEYAMPASSLDEAHSFIGTRWGENPNAVALINIAKQLGYDVDNLSRANWNRYNAASRALTPDEAQRLLAQGLDPEDYNVSLKMRASDHTRTSSQHEAPDINLSPEGDDFLDAIMKLRQATIDDEGQLTYQRNPF